MNPLILFLFDFFPPPTDLLELHYLLTTYYSHLCRHLPKYMLNDVMSVLTPLFSFRPAGS